MVQPVTPVTRMMMEVDARELSREERYNMKQQLLLRMIRREPCQRTPTPSRCHHVKRAAGFYEDQIAWKRRRDLSRESARLSRGVSRELRTPPRRSNTPERMRSCVIPHIEQILYDMQRINSILGR